MLSDVCLFKDISLISFLQPSTLHRFYSFHIVAVIAALFQRASFLTFSVSLKSISHHSVLQTEVFTESLLTVRKKGRWWSLDNVFAWYSRSFLGCGSRTTTLKKYPAWITSDSTATSSIFISIISNKIYLHLIFLLI